MALIQTRSLYVSSAPADARRGKRVAVIGSGISGLSCAWALDPHHEVTIFEADLRIGGHSHTVDIPAHLAGAAGPVAVDTGFIVYNEASYPNLTALFAHLGIETDRTDMSFAVSLEQGRLEYGTSDLRALFAQPANLANPRFWRMLAELRRFYRLAPGAAETLDPELSLGDWLASIGRNAVLVPDHLLPMAAAIWSIPQARVLDHPARAFLRFCENHGLLQVRDRPVWRTVRGGARRYVERLCGQLSAPPATGRPVHAIRPQPNGQGVLVEDRAGILLRFDEVILACHAPDALSLLPSECEAQRQALRQFTVTRNRAVLHSDPALMPIRRAAWSSWNMLGERVRPNAVADGPERMPCVTYWMNRLQKLDAGHEILLTLNPQREPSGIIHEQIYTHPRYDRGSQAAQRALWSLQGRNNIWFAGAWLGAGFHEDGLQSGLAVAEALGGVRRPWSVARENGRMPNALTAALAPASLAA